MIVLQAKDLTKSYGANEIFHNVTFTVLQGEKIGLIGTNGAGKTTLMRCLTGEESQDMGIVIKSDKIRLGYLEQIPDFQEGTTLFDAIMEMYADIIELRHRLRELEITMGQEEGDNLAKVMEVYAQITEKYERLGGFSCESNARKIAAGLGFNESELNKDITLFSGGEKTRISLARLLVRKPEILLLDEPTNHLDLRAIEWLENYLRAYNGSLILISHDRYFLDQITNKIIEMENGSIQNYKGNYSEYLRQKSERILAQNRAYEKQQKVIEETKEYINKYRAGIKAKQARGRQSKLDRLEKVDMVFKNSSIQLAIDNTKLESSGNVVLQIEGLSFGYTDQHVFKNLNFNIYKKDKVALIGGNGVGKTTLLKLILKEQKPWQGLVYHGSRVNVGYFDQEHSTLNESNTLIDELTYEFGLTKQEARDRLAAFLFIGDDVFKKVGALSGGEKGRLALLKILIEAPNFLILDEPTNHLDMASKEIVEEYLKEYVGTLLIVSHDRYLIDKVTDRTLELKDQSLKEYHGNYTYYREKKEEELHEQDLIKKEQEKLNKDKKRRNAAKESRPKINKAKTREKITQMEKNIEQMEIRLEELSEILAESTTYQDEEKVKKLLDEYKELEEDIPKTYTEWENLLKLLEPM